MKSFNYLYALLVIFTIVSCGSDDDDTPSGTPSNCEVTFMPLLSDESEMTISSSFANNNSVYVYYQHPYTFKSLLANFSFGLIMPQGSSDCRIEGNRQIWEADVAGTYLYNEITYLENQTNVNAQIQSSELGNIENEFWEMNDHSSGYIEGNDQSTGERSETNWARTDGNIAIDSRGYLDGLLIEQVLATYNVDESGSYQISRDGNTETITWNTDGSGTYTNLNDPSYNDSW